MKQRTETPEPAAKPLTDAEVRAIVFEWAKGRRYLDAEQVVIQIEAYNRAGIGTTLLTVATKEWALHDDDEPMPGIYGRAEEGD